MLTAQIRANESNSENTAENPAIYNIAFATEQPVTRFDAGIGEYQEVLLCNPENVDLTRLNSGTGTLLYNHDWNQHVGGIKSCTVDADKVCRADVQFSDYGIGPDIKGKVLEKTLQGVSFGYEILEYEIVGSTLFATKWAPYEISIVTVPADITVGLGRAMPVDTEEEEEQTEAVDNQDEENLENEPVTEQSEQDVSAEPDAVENTSNEGSNTTVEATEPAEVPAQNDSAETEPAEPAELAESESTVTESETDENSDNSINNSNESGDNTDNKEPDPAQANAEEDEKEIRAMASAFKFNQSATLDLVKQYHAGESLENIREMIRSGTITIKNNKNNKGTTMSNIKSVISAIAKGETSNLERGQNGYKFKYSERDLASINSIGGNLTAIDQTVARPDLFISPEYGVTALAQLPVTIKTGIMDSINIPVAKRSTLVPQVGTLANPADKFVLDVEMLALERSYVNVYAPFDYASVQYGQVDAVEEAVKTIFNLIGRAQEDLLVKTIEAKLPAGNKLSGTAADFDDNVLDAIAELSSIYPELHLVMSPRTLGKVRRIKKGGAEAVATSEYLYDDTNNAVRGVPVVQSTLVPDNVVYVGAWVNGFIVQFGNGGEAEVIRDAATANYVLWVHAAIASNAADVANSFFKITLTA